MLETTSQEVALSLGLSSLLFAVYSEYKTGNVWIRTDQNGDRSPSITKLGKFMASPFWKRDMWRRELLHQNFLVFSLTTTALVGGLKRGVAGFF